MSVKLENSFHVDAPPEEVWPLLLDIERVASCLPGATVRPGPDDRTFLGAMQLRLGPLKVGYEGSLELVEVDEDRRTATLRARARERGGQGSAAATIRNRLEPDGTGTLVVAETELDVTGRQAQFGRGVMQDVADRMLAQFAQRMQALLSAPAEAQVAGEERAEGLAPPRRGLPRAPTLPPRRAAALAAGGGLVVGVLALLARLRRPRRGITVRIDL